MLGDVRRAARRRRDPTGELPWRIRIRSSRGSEAVLGSTGVRRACCFGVRVSGGLEELGGGGSTGEGGVCATSTACFGVVVRVRIGRVVADGTTR